MELDLSSGGWKYYAEFVKKYAPNAIGQSLNTDPNLTILEIDDTPLRSNIPGLGNASSNQITLPSGLEYSCELFSSTASDNSNNYRRLIPIAYNVTDSVPFSSGDEIYQDFASFHQPLKTSFRLLPTSAKILDFRLLKTGPAALRVTRGHNTYYNFSNSTANLDFRTRIKIYAK